MSQSLAYLQDFRFYAKRSAEYADCARSTLHWMANVDTNDLALKANKERALYFQKCAKEYASAARCMREAYHYCDGRT